MEMIGHIYTILALILGTIQIFSGYEYNSPLTFSWSCLLILRASLVAQLVKNPPTMQETLLWSLDWEDPLEKGTTTHSRFLCPWDSPGQNTGVDCHSFSRGPSWPSDQTQVSCIVGGFFTSWATREAHPRALRSLHCAEEIGSATRVWPWSLNLTLIPVLSVPQPPLRDGEIWNSAVKFAKDWMMEEHEQVVFVT